MTREAVIETFENLAMSNGTYGRLLRFLEDLRDVDPWKFEEIMTALEGCSDSLDMIMTLEETG